MARAETMLVIELLFNKKSVSAIKGPSQLGASDWSVGDPSPSYWTARRRSDDPFSSEIKLIGSHRIDFDGCRRFCFRFCFCGQKKNGDPIAQRWLAKCKKKRLRNPATVNKTLGIVAAATSNQTKTTTTTTKKNKRRSARAVRRKPATKEETPNPKKKQQKTKRENEINNAQLPTWDNSISTQNKRRTVASFFCCCCCCCCFVF